MSAADAIRTEYPPLQVAMIEAIMACSVSFPLENNRTAERANCVGVSLRYLNHYIKNGRVGALTGRSRVAMLRARNRLEQKGLIETYRLNEWQMVAEGGRTTHVALTGAGQAIAYILVTNAAGVTPQSADDVTTPETVTGN